MSCQIRARTRWWTRFAVPALLVGAWASASGAQPEAASAAHDYDLASRDAISSVVELDSGGFDWPLLDPMAGTVLLELDVKARSPRKSLPWIKISIGDETTTQYVERGANGRRYVNLSEFGRDGWPDSGTRVSLTGWRLSWTAGEANLFSFRSPSLSGARVLVVAPHPDDAEIAAFGIYATTDADVVTVTAGDAGGMNFKVLYPEPEEHFRAKGWIRTVDSLVVPQIGGVPPGRSRNLGFFDATLRQLFEQPDSEIPPPYAELDRPSYFRELNVDPDLAKRPFVGSWKGLVEDLLNELERVRPDVVVVPHPHLDRHPDHQYAAIAFFEALEQSKLDPALLLYTNHPMEAEVSPYGPRESVASLPPWYGEELPFDGVFSFSLDAELQRTKLFALEAMHDLRAFDIDGPDRPREEFKQWIQSLRRMGRKRSPTYSYYRRGARPNELFFVADRETAGEIRRSFLASEAE